ncbi:HDL488Cp [Eremothecium sinecaudum]|uniref:HDL488Cp n=1 Tax=Eremothecium sinecaudum TaxID=45286 RepID=A0A0X8HRT9_9SACH|nr:HDL488Cp [Eremothecium sinecaudum]AMD20256.1 HDL488Cp [Eremothecium sinecaudum]
MDVSEAKAALFSSDPQIVFSSHAVKRYENSQQEIEDDRKSGHKRHIISVGDHLKINYEVVKNVPGNLIELATTKGKKTPEQEEIARIAKFKSLYYKEQLNKLHDDFVTKSSILRAEDNEMHARAAAADAKEQPSLQQQYEWLQEIQSKLLQQYNEVVQEEKRWYLKKEVLLDANIRLDLFSTRDHLTGTVNMGKDTSHKSCIF